MKTSVQKLTWSLLALSLLMACTDDYFEFDKIKTTEWKPEIALPLINSSLELKDILANKDSAGIVTSGPNGILQIFYEGNVVSKFGGEKIKLDDQTDQFSFSGITVPPTSPITVPFNTAINYNPSGGVEVDSAIMKEGSFVLTIESEFQHPVTVLANFPGFKDAGGTVLQITLNIPASNGITASSRSVITDLTGYHIDMTNGGSTVNNIPINTQITISPIAGNPSSTNDELRFSSSLRNLNFRQLHGYVGQDELDLSSDTILVALFRNFNRGRFFLADPTLDIRISNSYGLPISLGFDYLNASTPNFNPPVQAINLGGNNPILLNSPSGPGTAYTSIVLNNRNSNIDTIISNLLKEITYDAKAIPNPSGNTGIRNFITDTSSIGIDVSLNLPFTGFASGMVMQDTIPFEFDNSDALERGIVRTRISNSFPIQGAMQLYFTDENYQLLDSLYSGGQEIIISPAPVGMNGFSSSRTQNMTDTEINRERLKKLKDSKFAIIRAELETTNGSIAVPDTVKFLSSYKLDVAIGLKASILIQ